MTFRLIDQISGCTDPSLVDCGPGFDFCCPAGEACSLDANGNAQCGGMNVGSGNGNGTTTTPTGNITTTTSNDFTTTTSSPQFTVINTNTLGNGNGGVTTTTTPLTTTTPHTTTSPTSVFGSKSTTSSVISGSQGGAGRFEVGVGAAVCVFAALVGAMVL